VSTLRIYKAAQPAFGNLLHKLRRRRINANSFLTAGQFDGVDWSSS
jgi:hypothetical protein